MTEKTTAVQIVMPQHCNGYAKPRLFGGQIMAWIDVTGAVAARRYAQKAVTTVCIDHLTFLKPAYLNDTVVLEAFVTWTGRTSMEVRVDSMVERLDGSRELINRAYAVFVALDKTTSRLLFRPLHLRQKRKSGNTKQRKSAENNEPESEIKYISLISINNYIKYIDR